MIFKGLSMKQITQFFLEGESPTLITETIQKQLLTGVLQDSRFRKFVYIPQENIGGGGVINSSFQLIQLNKIKCYYLAKSLSHFAFFYYLSNFPAV